MSTTEAAEADYDFQEPVQDFVFATSSCRHESNAEKVSKYILGTFDTTTNGTRVSVAIHVIVGY